MNTTPANQPMAANSADSAFATRRGRLGKGILAILLSLTPIALLLGNVGSRTSGVDFRGRAGEWTRAWDDVAIGAGFAGYRAFPVAPYLVTNLFRRKGHVAFAAFKETFSDLERVHNTGLSRPWEGFDAKALFPRRPRVAQRFDDSGRAYLLGWSFRLLGVVSPGMLFWLGPILASLVLLWIVLESWRAGFPVFGVALAFLISLSAFCLDVLILGYSAAGFYLIAILASLAYAIGVAGQPSSLLSLAGRSFVVGALLAACVAARSLSAAVVPALLLTALFGIKRLQASRFLKVVGAVASLTFILAPTLLLRAHLDASARDATGRFGGETVPASHDLWISYWQGLGDFDRTRGHTFLDEAGLAALQANGGDERVSERSEAIMRRLVFADIRADPVWFLEILMKRALLTVSLRKLWPMASSSEPGFYPSTSSNEGGTDGYWTMTAQADTFRLGTSGMEVPAVFLPVALLLFFLAQRWLPGTGGRSLRDSMIRCVGLVFVAAILGPVAASTAGAFEPQCMVVVSFAAMAGLTQMGWWRAGRT